MALTGSTSLLIIFIFSPYFFAVALLAWIFIFTVVFFPDLMSDSIKSYFTTLP
ncbi:hypothetical protein A2U01_0068612, partial [Trifolium medium]|nr:hypothetical protein [Trifolium medium]